MALSKELQIERQGNICCTDLILKGYNAFLSDQGVPFDVLVEKDNTIYRVQVKSTLEPKNWGHSKHNL